MRVSYSRYEKFLSCPERYRLQYIQKVPEGPNVWLGAGTAMGEACDELDLKDVSVPEATEFFQQKLDQYLGEAEVKFGMPRSEFETTGKTKGGDRPNGRDQDWWNGNAGWMLQNYRDWRSTSGYTVATVDGKPAVELEFNLDLGNGTTIIGYLDRLEKRPDGGYEVMDLKSGQRQPGLYQLVTYAYAMEVMYGIKVDYGSFFMLAKEGAHGGHSSPQYLAYYKFNNSVQLAYRRLDESIKSGFFVPNVGSECRNCPVRKACQFT